MNLSLIKKELLKNGIPVIEVIVSEDIIVDHQITITENIHVQVGGDYFAVVEQTDEGTFKFMPYRESLKYLVPDLKSLKDWKV